MADRRKTYNNYYVDGNTVRKMETAPERRQMQPGRNQAAPARRQPQPTKKQPVPKTRAQRKRQRVAAAQAKREYRQRNRQWVDELRYGVFIACMAICAVGLCIYILKLNADVKEERDNVITLQAQLTEQLNTNAEYNAGLESMTDLDEIYKVATKELGMVYSKPGQTVYYPQNNDDYVIQYKNIPEAE